MKQAFWSRRLHKWLGLLVGIQALFWMASGLYMTAISIDVIHGDHLSHVERPPVSAGAVKVTPARLAELFPTMTAFKLKRLLEKEVFEVKHAGGLSLVDATSGQRLDPLDQRQAQSVAQDAYQGEGDLRGMKLLTQLPQEVASRKGPLWRADFEDDYATTLWISPSTGEVVAKRHTLWRIFDFLWMLHIMDYETRDDVNNTLLRVASVLGTLFAFSGIWLLWFTVRSRRATV